MLGVDTIRHRVALLNQTLSEDNRKLIVELMAEDYANGWC